jgi:hypothetical protein
MTKKITGTPTPPYQHNTGTTFLSWVPFLIEKSDTGTASCLAAISANCFTKFLFFPLVSGSVKLLLDSVLKHWVRYSKAYSLCLLLLTVKNCEL